MFWPGRVIAPRLAGEILAACDLKIHHQAQREHRISASVLKATSFSRFISFCSSASKTTSHSKHQPEPQPAKQIFTAIYQPITLLSSAL
jgi:hypothetical protein